MLGTDVYLTHACLDGCNTPPALKYFHANTFFLISRLGMFIPSSLLNNEIQKKKTCEYFIYF